jgi:hypothetical protein
VRPDDRSCQVHPAAISERKPKGYDGNPDLFREHLVATLLKAQLTLSSQGTSRSRDDEQARLRPGRRIAGLVEERLLDAHRGPACRYGQRRMETSDSTPALGVTGDAEGAIVNNAVAEAWVDPTVSSEPAEARRHRSRPAASCSMWPAPISSCHFASTAPPGRRARERPPRHGAGR